MGLFVVLLDQFTKYLALTFLSGHDSLPIFPGIFHLTFVRNTGIAFGFFREHESLLLVFISLSLIVLIIWGLRMPPGQLFQRWGLALILGGAIGNWIDRLRFGAVIDFFDFRVWPVFNVADSAITIGVVLYLLVFLKKSNTESKT